VARRGAGDRKRRKQAHFLPLAPRVAFQTIQGRLVFRGARRRPLRQAMNQRQIQALPPLKIGLVMRIAGMGLDQRGQQSLRRKITVREMRVDFGSIGGRMQRIA